MSTLWPKLLDKLRRLCGYRFPRLGPIAFAAIQRTFPATIRTELFPGIHATLDLSDETQRTTYWFGTRFEKPTPEVFRTWGAQATHFFDIGSNYGFYSFYLHSLFPQLEIYPFEPNPVSFRRLQEICQASGTTRIHPQFYGLSDETQRLRFLQLSDNTGHSSFATVKEFGAGRPLPSEASLTECDVVRFDEAAERLGLEHPARPDWVAKIDVEGYEMKVLLGMRRALELRAFKGICIELVADNLALAGTTIEEVDAMLHAHGYQKMPVRDADQKRGRNDNAFYVPGRDSR